MHTFVSETVVPPPLAFNPILEVFLASQDALEVMRVTYLLTYLLTESLSDR